MIVTDRALEEETPSNEEGQQPPDPPASRTVSQDDLEKMVARAADRASRSATKALASEFGFDKVSDLKSWVSAQREAEAEAQSESERAAAKLAEDQAKITAAGNALTRDRLAVKIERAVVRSGVTDDKKLDRLQTLVLAEIDDVEAEDSWGDQIAAAVEGLQSDMPELFASAGSHGSGDGGARGGSEPPEPDDEAQQEQSWKEEYAGRGYATADFSDL